MSGNRLKRILHDEVFIKIDKVEMCNTFFDIL